jgi:DNA-binding transcriptional LysR family regulator
MTPEREREIRRLLAAPGGQEYAQAGRDLLAALDQARGERDERAQALSTLRGAWNAHFAYCISPMSGGVTTEQLLRWRNAPSDTASA